MELSSSAAAERFRAQLAEGFELTLFEAALQAFEQSTNSARHCFFSLAIRELSRHVLKRLAPDEEIRACKWYQEPEDDGVEFTRAQRMTYAVQGGLEDAYIADELNFVSSRERKQDLAETIRSLSKLVHIERSALEMEPAEMMNQAESALMNFAEFFEMVDQLRIEVAEKIDEQLNTAVVDSVISETILELDELANHYFIESVYTHSVTVSEIGADTIFFVADGDVDCYLQWGSGSDVRKGDGVVMPVSFPFRCFLKSEVSCPDQLSTNPLEDLVVDTSSWYDNYGD